MSKYIEEQQEVVLKGLNMITMIGSDTYYEVTEVELNTLTKTLILNTLKEIQEVLGEEKDIEVASECLTDVEEGYNLLHRKLTKKINQIRE